MLIELVSSNIFEMEIKYLYILILLNAIIHKNKWGESVNNWFRW